MTQKFSNARILDKVTNTPQTTREIANRILYVDKNGKTWKPAFGTVATKLNMLCEAGLIVRVDVISKKRTWYKTKE